MAPDGSLVVSPCRLIVTNGLAPGSEARRTLVEERVYGELYNTNFTASWWLVRGGVRIDASGNLKSMTPGCEVSLVSRNSTVGPLPLSLLDSSQIPTNTVPLLGCGRPGSPLVKTIGPHQAGSLTVRSFTRGPVVNPTMIAPSFAAGTSRGGPTGWWAVWTHNTLQDYRNFAPVHEHTCNLLFADGSVRSVLDYDEDGLLNNGFVPTVENGFSSPDVEIGEDEVYSGWSLRKWTY
jgi:prepilin-type processing-associated H-X9-DG protein